MFVEEVKLIRNVTLAVYPVNGWRQCTASWLATKFIELSLFSRMAAHYMSLYVIGFAKRGCCFPCLPKNRNALWRGKRKVLFHWAGCKKKTKLVNSGYSQTFFIIGWLLAFLCFYKNISHISERESERVISFIWPGLQYLVKRFLFIVFKFCLFCSVSFLDMLILPDYVGYLSSLNEFITKEMLTTQKLIF